MRKGLARSLCSRSILFLLLLLLTNVFFDIFPSRNYLRTNYFLSTHNPRFIGFDWLPDHVNEIREIRPFLAINCEHSANHEEDAFLRIVEMKLRGRFCEMWSTDAVLIFLVFSGESSFQRLWVKSRYVEVDFILSGELIAVLYWKQLMQNGLEFHW